MEPFSRWCGAHEDRVNASHEDLQGRIKTYDKQHDQVKKLRSHYFNKCRLVEDLEEETKFISQVQPDSVPNSASLQTPQIKLPENEEEDEDPLEIGDEYMQPGEVKTLLVKMLDTIPLSEVKVAILGTYQNTATGDQIVDYFQKHLGATSVSYAERIGQDLVTHGFLRLVGAVGSSFANSSKMNYQFRPKAFQWAGIPQKLMRKPTDRVNSGLNGEADTPQSPAMSYVGDYLGNLLNQNPNETPADRLRREAHEADERYKAGVKKLDLMRCALEEAIMDHLKFMERCELDRLKAIKAGWKYAIRKGFRLLNVRHSHLGLFGSNLKCHSSHPVDC